MSSDGTESAPAVLPIVSGVEVPQRLARSDAGRLVAHGSLRWATSALAFCLIGASEYGQRWR